MPTASLAGLRAPRHTPLSTRRHRLCGSRCAVSQSCRGTELGCPSAFVQSRAPTTTRTASGKRQSRMALRHMLAAREGLTPPVRGSGHASARAGYEFRRANLVNPQDNTPPPCQGAVALVDCCNQLTKKKSSGALMARHVASLKVTSLNSRSEWELGREEGGLNWV